MKAIQVREVGGPDVLRPVDTGAPEAGPGEVVVDVELAGVTYADTMLRAGRYPFPLPYVAGMEVGGRVASVGPDVDPGLVGRRVVATTVDNRGGYAERARAAATGAFAVPDGLALEHALAVFQSGAVAAGILAALPVRPGETVLVTAAAGRIGSLLVQLARTAGARVIGSCGPAKLDAARDIGAHVAVDHTRPDWPDAVRAATDGRGADLVLDAIGGETGARAVDAAADAGGRIGLYGFTSGTWTPLDAHTVARRGISVSGPLGVAFAKPADEQRADAERALAAAADGTLVPRIHATYPLVEAARAHAELDARRTVGAVVLAP